MTINYKNKTILSIGLVVAGFAIMSVAMGPVIAFAQPLPPKPPTPREVVPPVPKEPLQARSAITAHPSFGCNNPVLGWHWDWHSGHWHWHPGHWVFSAGHWTWIKGTWHWHPPHWTCNHNAND